MVNPPAQHPTVAGDGAVPAPAVPAAPAAVPVDGAPAPQDRARALLERAVPRAPAVRRRAFSSLLRDIVKERQL